MGVARFFKKMFSPDYFHPRRFLSRSEQKEIRKKIREIETAAHSKIVIHLVRDHKGDLHDRAVKEFSRHKLFHREVKTGILLLISLKSRQFQILGDEDIHAKLGEDGWSRLASRLSALFKEEKYFEGLAFLLDELGEHLKLHFPKARESGSPGQAEQKKESPSEEKQ